MEISGAGKQKEVSAEALELVARVRAKARAKRASHLELFGVLGDGTMSREGQSQHEDSVAGSSDSGAPNEGMVSGHKAEAARGNFVNTFRVEAARKKKKGEPKPAGSSYA